MAGANGSRSSRHEQSDERLIDAVPRHAGGRARRRRQHARRLSARPRRLRGYLAGKAHRSRPPTTDDVRAYLAELEQARLCGRLGRAPAVGDPPALPLPLCGRAPQRRSGRHPRGPEARPHAAQGAVASPRSTACSRRARGAAMRPSAAARSGCGPRGSPACSSCSTPPACGSPSWSRCRPRRRGAMRACCGARQGRQGAAGAAQRGGQARDARLSRRWLGAKPATRRGKSKWLFPSFGESGHLTRQHFARELKALAGGAGLRADAGQPARAAPRLRQPSAAQRRRPARRADAARPRRHLDHADLHPCAGGAAQEPGARPASAGATRNDYCAQAGPVLSRQARPIPMSRMNAARAIACPSVAVRNWRDQGSGRSCILERLKAPTSRASS